MPVDWKRIEDDIRDVMWKMVNEEHKPYGPGFYTELLQRVLGYKPAGEDGSCESLDWRLGVITYDKAVRDRDGACAHADMLKEQAEQKVAELRAEVRRVYAEAGRDLADDLRRLAGRETSKYRREGIERAADSIDPRVIKS